MVSLKEQCSVKIYILRNISPKAIKKSSQKQSVKFKRRVPKEIVNLDEVLLKLVQEIQNPPNPT
jgi:hypothetical protein